MAELHNEPCFVAQQTKDQMQAGDYFLNPKAYIRNGNPAAKPPSVGLGVFPSSYGGLGQYAGSPRVTQDSYMSGRGAISSNCPAGGVNFLPASIFPPTAPVAADACQNTTLQSLSTRVPRSCACISEVVNQRMTLPESKQQGYQGLGSVVSMEFMHQQPRSSVSTSVLRPCSNAAQVANQTSYGKYVFPSTDKYAGLDQPHVYHMSQRARSGGVPYA